MASGSLKFKVINQNLLDLDYIK